MTYGLDKRAVEITFFAPLLVIKVHYVNMHRKPRTEFVRELPAGQCVTVATVWFIVRL
jgi:hypothetical protein